MHFKMDIFGCQDTPPPLSFMWELPFSKYTSLSQVYYDVTQLSVTTYDLFSNTLME